ncbi:hypothetical protein JHK85_010976 [Glycine max]|nr:hypothetical protein JHK85_010976 [Glycine max]
MESSLYDFYYSATYSDESTMAPFAPSNKPVFGKEEDVSKVLRAKVASHPLFPHLLHAYMDCHKVGAPQDVAHLLEGIKGEHTSGVCQISESEGFLGTDPELDDFMGTFCDLLVKYKSDLLKPFNEATMFLNLMETQLHSICNNTPPQPVNQFQFRIKLLSLICAYCAGSEDYGFDLVENKSDHIERGKNEVTHGSPGKDLSRVKKEAIEGKRMEVQELKDNLLRRYSGYITNLRHEFSKKKKKEKLPKEAKQILLSWWNVHFKWPYPTDADKVALAEWTGLDQKQVNNWFINQRKRHWKPTEEMHAEILDDLQNPNFSNPNKTPKIQSRSWRSGKFKIVGGRRRFDDDDQEKEVANGVKLRVRMAIVDEEAEAA